MKSTNILTLVVALALTAVSTYSYSHDHGEAKKSDKQKSHHHDRHHDKDQAQSVIVKESDAERLLVGPDLNKVDIYIANDSGNGKMSAGLEYLKSNSRVPAHIHNYTEEIIYIVEGDGLALLNGKEQPVKGGDVILIAPGSAHGLTNIGNKELKFFVVYSDNGMMDFFRDYSFKDMNDVRERFSPEFMMNLFKKHGKAFSVPADVVPLFPTKGEEE